MTEKHLHGREEPILEPDLPLIDTHHHLYVRPNVRYMLPEFQADLQAGHDIQATVYLETRFMSRPDGPEHLRPLGEVEFANGLGAMGASGFFGPCRFAAGIVAHADLTRPDAEVAEYLDLALQAAPARLKGVRQISMDSADASVFAHLATPPRQGLLRDAGLRRNLSLLAERGLSYDAAIFSPQMGELGGLADENPDLQIILNHLGFALCLPHQTPAGVFDAWAAGLHALAKRPNVSCKIGGLGAAYWGFGFHEGDRVISSEELAAAWKPYITEALRAFGPDRCMLESNYPPDGRSCGYVPMWNAYKICLADLSRADREKVAAGTARRIYRL